MISHARVVVCVVTFCTLIFSGCTQFQSSKRLDMNAFGENTSAMVSDMKNRLAITRPILTQRYFPVESTSQYEKQKHDVVKVLGGIVLYSTQVVNLSRSRLSEKEQAAELGNYIARLATPVIDEKDPDIHISKENFDEMVKTISSQDTLLKALESAQPFVVAVETYVSHSLENLNELVAQISEATATNIYLQSADVLESRNNLESLEVQSIRSFSILNSVKSGDPDALAVLFKSDPALKRIVKEGTKVNQQDMAAMEHELMTRLQNIHVLLEHIKPQIDDYHAEITELDDIVQQVEGGIRKMRITVTLWSRSHSSLATGVAVPPEIDLAGMLTGATSSVVSKVVP